MNMRKFLISIAALSAATQANAAVNILSNGSFESGFSDWVVGGSNGNAAPVVIEYGQGGAYPVGAYGEAVPAVNSSIIVGAFANPNFGPGVGTHALYLS